MNLYLVQQSRLQVLAHDGRASPDPDVLLPGGSLGVLEGRLDPVRNEVVGGAALHGHRITHLVGEHEYRPLERRRVAPGLYSMHPHKTTLTLKRTETASTGVAILVCEPFT
jgi:hypothetical protein